MTSREIAFASFAVLCVLALRILHEKLAKEQAREVIAKAKPIYHVMGGLHSAETGPTEMLKELAYRIATEDSPVINQIRDNVIVTITPVAEPDGRDRLDYGFDESRRSERDRC